MDLATLASAAFASRLGQQVIVEAAEAELALEVWRVKETPLAAGPKAARVPFIAVLRGPDSPCLAEGCYDLRTEGEQGWRLEAVHIARIFPPADSDGAGAFYQIIFG